MTDPDCRPHSYLLGRLAHLTCGFAARNWSVQAQYTWHGRLPNQTHHSQQVLTQVLMAAVGTAVLVQTVRTRTWFMLIASVVAYLEVAGFALRISMLSKPLRGNYIAMQCLLIIPPSFLALVRQPSMPLLAIIPMMLANMCPFL